jgi:5-methylcytosine-specific restriction protein B
MQQCLQLNGSLIRDSVSLWTPANLDTLHSVFVDAADEGNRSFLEKLSDQIKPAGSEICNLAGELLAVYFLFPSNVGAVKKKEIVNQVLGWGGQSIPSGSLVDLAFAEGIGGAGQGYNTRRPYEIAFLIEMARSWKRLSEVERSTASGDPWKFMEFVDSVEDVDGKQGRHIVLHILFPDTFERIASREQKRRIVRAFSSLLGDPAVEESDRSLLEIRGKLESLLSGKELDFYWTPLREVWKDSGDGGVGATPMDALRYKKQVVLYGPPGTGKTYRANQIADRIIRAALLDRMHPKEYFERAHAGTIDREITRRIHVLQFHAAYGYEEFIRGLHLDKSGATVYRLGALPKLVEKMREDDPDIPHVLILDEINRTDLSRTLGECFSLLENRDRSIDLPAYDSDGQTMTLSIPKNLYVIGTMNLIDQSIEQMDFALRRRFLWVLCPYDAEALVAAAQELWKRDPNRITWDRVESDFIKLAAAASALNSEIHNSALLGGQYEIGHTYFLDTVSFLKDELGVRPQTFLWSKNGKAKRPVEQAWEFSLKPLISEYMAGLETKSRDAEIRRLQEVFLTAPEAAD